MCSQEIDFAELVDLMKNRQVQLIDVREASELQKDGRIPDSINIPVNEIAEALTLSPEKFMEKYSAPKPNCDANIVFSCRSGRRAAIALEKAKELGYINARVYVGSFQDWVGKGGDVIRT